MRRLGLFWTTSRCPFGTFAPHSSSQCSHSLFFSWCGLLFHGCAEGGLISSSSARLVFSDTFHCILQRTTDAQEFSSKYKHCLVCAEVWLQSESISRAAELEQPFRLRVFGRGQRPSAIVFFYIKKTPTRTKAKIQKKAGEATVPQISLPKDR